MNRQQELAQFEALFLQYYKTLRNYAFRFVADNEAAKDIVQDVFFELWLHREEFIFDDSIKAYLFKSIYNRSINYLNTKAYQTSVSLELSNENQFMVHLLKSQNPESNLFLKELEKEINAFIQTLPPQCKRVFILSRIDELRNKEIADQLNISIKAVEKHITKALSGLRSLLKEKGLLFIMLLLKQFLIFSFSFCILKVGLRFIYLYNL